MKPQILLFINYSNGLKHNAVYDNLQDIYTSLEQLRAEEEINDNIPTVEFFKIHLEDNDDYFQLFQVKLGFIFNIFQYLIKDS